jgi:hypothetical protein
MSLKFQTCMLSQLVKQITEGGQRNFVANLQKIHAPLSKALALVMLRVNDAKGSFRVEWHTVQNRLSVVNDVATILGKNLMHPPNYRFYPLREMFLVGRLFLQGRTKSGLEESDSILGIIFRIEALKKHLEPQEVRELMLVNNSAEYVIETFADHFQRTVDEGLFSRSESIDLLVNGGHMDLFMNHYATPMFKKRWHQLGLV